MALDDEFFIGCNCLPEYAQLLNPEIDVFCFSGFQKTFYVQSRFSILLRYLAVSY